VRKARQTELEAEADFQINGDVESHPSNWPAWTDAHVYVPTESERSWWAQMIDNDIKAEASVRLERRALESRAVDNLSRGLIAPDVAERIAMTRTGGHPA
jgi:hypothetical protein